MAAAQECSEAGCSKPAAFKTRTRPAWCDDHITAILWQGGLQPLAPFAKPFAYRLTRCLRCGCEAHYRFEYTLDRNALGEATCRACYWRQWAERTRALQREYAHVTPVPAAEARQHAENNGYDYLEALTRPSLPDDPHRVRCRYCHRVSAQRLADIGWGCSCQVNPRRDRQTSKPTTRSRPNLLKDSDLSAVHWWDHEHNDASLWQTVTVLARREAHWVCPDCTLRFSSRILDMAKAATCPACEPVRRASRQAELERYRVTPVANVPELLEAWADEADPRRVTVAGDPALRRFRCPRGHHPRITPLSYLRSGCPTCRGAATREENTQNAALDPSTHRLNAEIASQWHPTNNDGVRLATVSPTSRRKFWWQDPVCGHEWQDTPANRERRQRLRCPECRTILDSLAYHFPALVSEWSPANPLTAWHVRPSGQTPFVPTWVCSADPQHVWTASVSSRTAGSSCPECRVHGKSNVELEHHAAAVAVFGRASSGQPVDSEAFRRRSRWYVDITAELPDGRLVMIDYDGSYWHANKADVDTEKSLDLLAGGFLVARLREHPLPALPVNHERYAEFVVHPQAPNPEGVMRHVRGWATGLGHHH
jgi:hypothetical protein